MTLMDCIQQYIVLYDKSKKGYKDQRKIKSAWREFSAKLGISEVEAQTRYKTIRTKFSKYIKGMRGKSVSGRSELPELKEEYEYLRWLAVHFKHRENTTNLGMVVSTTSNLAD